MKTMTPDRIEALTDIRMMLGLEGTKLTETEQWTLLDLFNSVPFGCRQDGSILSSFLRPAVLSLAAFGRGETRCTVATSPMLQDMLKTLARDALHLAGVNTAEATGG